MKLFAIIILSAIIIFLSVQIYRFSGLTVSAQNDFSVMKAKLDQAKLDAADFQSELDYYTNPVNLEKELRARFNYKSPGENMIIIVPSTSSATSSGQ
ncbi:MAG: hypothetical protein KGJ89_00300 [Patescibacteria group bacterium]|nr:hypothetical protein [Patescibacteria group bacterium]MDE2014961.1 hypothetical protein [Patescibacteria group bacterium]MDE2226390.1 hypothetical protein [Patescibacteria group bacterium]